MFYFQSIFINGGDVSNAEMNLLGDVKRVSLRRRVVTAGHSYPSVLALLLMISITASSGLAEAAPKKLELRELPQFMEGRFWEAVDRYAFFSVALRNCETDPNFEQRFVRTVHECIEDTTIHVVTKYYRNRLAHYKSKIKNFCTDEYVKSNSLLNKMRLTLEDRIREADAHCRSYLETGMVPRQ